MARAVLLVHDDPRVCALIRRILEPAGYGVNEAAGLVLADSGRPDVLLIAWSHLNPAERWLPALREHEPMRHCRVVVLAPRCELGAAAASLAYGADDAVGIPLDPKELIARVDACLRRAAAAVHGERIAAGPITLDKSLHRVLVADRPVELAPTEFRLLAFFLENPDRVFSRGELLRRAWSRNVTAGPRTVDVHVRRLRQQLEPFGCERVIQTVRGFGYRLSVDVSGARHPGDRLAVRGTRP